MANNGLRGPWPGPKGLIPEPDQNAADANAINRRYLDSIYIEMRILDATEADLTTEIFGKTYASPIMTPAFSHLNKVGENGRTPMEEYAFAAKEMKVLNWCGMESNETFKEIMNVNPDTVRIIKPFRNHDQILEQIDQAVELGAPAVGIDIDHVIGTNGKYDVVDGQPLGPVRSSDLKSYVRYAKVPFIAKGVLSLQDALKCKEAGAAAIVISHHHGRMPFAIPPLSVLPAIKNAVGNDMKIFVDCGMDTGRDAYKALALGADAVSVGRGILPGLLKDGSKGVTAKMNKMNQELAELMGYTGVRTVRDFDASALWINGQPFLNE